MDRFLKNNLSKDENISLNLTKFSLSIIFFFNTGHSLCLHLLTKNPYESLKNKTFSCHLITIKL